MSVAHPWQQSHTARFRAYPAASGTVITVEGELDAANADQLAAYVERSVTAYRRVILDLRGLEFIGTAGFSALHRINAVCSDAPAAWALAPGPAVSRLLRLCDPDGALPVTTPAEEPLLRSAKRAGGGDSAALLQLVPQPR